MINWILSCLKNNAEEDGFLIPSITDIEFGNSLPFDVRVNKMGER